jgi:hypothetical protein
MEIVNRELARHHLIFVDAKSRVYSSKKHHKGIDAYQDKKRLYDIEINLKENGQLMTIEDFQFLESIYEKY